MRFAWLMVILVVGLAAVATAKTNEVLAFNAEKRAGAVIFVDECLARGLTNSIALPSLREWTTNTIQRYRKGELVLATNNSPSKKYTSVAKSDIPKPINAMQENIPSCKFSYADKTNAFHTITADRKPPEVTFFRDATGDIEALSISWYAYGVLVGAHSFEPQWEHKPWYQRKVADGVYLVHGYK